ncbi:caspase family protein [Hoeflea alexandrii]
MRNWASQILVAIALTALYSQIGNAQTAGRWGPLDTEDGIGTGVCDKRSGGQVCFALQCGRNRGLEISLTTDYNAFDGQKRATISIDGHDEALLAWSGDQRHIAYQDDNHSPLIEALRGGSRAEVVSDGKVFPLSLSGSSKEIDRVLSACERKQVLLASGISSFGNAFARYEDEATMSFPPEGGSYDWSFKKYSNTDIWGNDLRSGLTDPLLQSMTLPQCEMLCSVTKKCMYFTHNGAANTCFLKTAVGKVKSYRGATTGEFLGSRMNLYPPPTRGSGLVIDPDLSLSAEDTTESWQARLRASASRIAGACNVELGTMKAASHSIKSEISGQAGQVGKALEFKWSGNQLKDRFPLWLIVSTNAPVRFSGAGFFALSPDAPNPFGISLGQGQHRALVALFARGAGFKGEFKINPLEAGVLSIKTSIVGYGRQCQTEETYSTQETNIDVEPGVAKLVLNNELGRRAFTHEVVIEEYSRRIVFNDTRILILNTADSSEIVERAGQELNISPTHRFAVVKHNERWEVIDIVDGITVATARDGEIMWAPGDSFVLTTAAPWGEVNIHSTFWDGINIVEQVTGPSCCSADRDGTRIGIDLENAVISVWGNYGWRVSALQNVKYSIGENTGSAYASAQTGHDGVYHHAMSSMGPAAPVSLARQWISSGQIKQLVNYSDRYVAPDKFDREESTKEAIVAKRLARVGLELRPVQKSRESISQLHTGKDNIKNTLDRMGIELAPSILGELLLEAPDYLNDFETGVSFETDIARAAPIMNELREIATQQNWRLRWTEPLHTGATTQECDHIAVGSKHGYGEPKGNYVPNDVVEILRVSTKEGDVWIARADCQAGGTFGTLRGQSALYVYDFGKPMPASIEEFEAASNGYLVNNRQKAFFENELRVKAVGDLLMIYAPAAGMISVYDRNLRDFIWIGEGLPDGDLLTDAFLTDNLQFVVQANNDGGLHIHRITDGQRVLSGRIVDDELAIWLDDFRFDATAEAAALVDLRFPGKQGQYSLDRFGSAKRVPGLARLVLNGTNVPEASVAQIPPDIKGKIALDLDGIIRLRIDHASGNPVAINLFQDGVLTNSFDMSQAAEDDYNFERMKGARWVSAVASDSKGLVSLPISVDLGTPVRREAVNRALVIGINTYNDPAIPSLNYALRDGGRFAETLASLTSKAAGFDDVAYLKDQRATPEAIVSGVEALLDGLEKGDHAVLFFAGHGFRSEDGVFHFGTSETRLDSIEESALAFDRISQLLERTQARITIILDACHAGATGTSAFATNDDVVTDLASLKSNITVLAASKGREFSQETAEAGGGIFTYALSRVLTADRAQYDLDNNGRIEASELYIGVKSIVVSERQGQQTPWMVRSRMVGDYALF